MDRSHWDSVEGGGGRRVQWSHLWSKGRTWLLMDQPYEDPTGGRTGLHDIKFNEMGSDGIKWDQMGSDGIQWDQMEANETDHRRKWSDMMKWDRRELEEGCGMDVGWMWDGCGMDVGWMWDG